MKELIFDSLKDTLTFMKILVIAISVIVADFILLMLGFLAFKVSAILGFFTTLLSIFAIVFLFLFIVNYIAKN